MADLDDSAIPSEDEDERDESQPDAEHLGDGPHVPGEAGEGGEEPGETLHLLREDAFDNVAISTWQSDVPITDELAEMVHNSLGAHRNGRMIRNKVSCNQSPLFILQNV
jgi:hypothetical protein